MRGFFLDTLTLIQKSINYTISYLNKISLETKSLVSSSFGKKIDLLQYPFYTYPFFLFKTILLLIFSSLSHESISFPLTPEFKKPTVKIKKDDDINSNIEMQLLSPQQSLQPTLQIPVVCTIPCCYTFCFFQLLDIVHVI